jgi:hypothetical protein
MDLALRQAIERGEAAWALAVAVPPASRLAPVRDALARLAGRAVPEARVIATGAGLIVWNRGEGEPAAAGRLAARLAELLPEAPEAVRRCRLPDDAEALAALAEAAPGWPVAEAWLGADPGGETLLSLRRTLASLPAETWIRRSPVVSLRPGATARLVARRLAPDAGVAAKAMPAGAHALPLSADALRLFEPLLLAALPRLIGAEPAETKLILPLVPETALGGGYDRLEQAIGRGGMARIIPAVALADAAAAPRAMASARARFAADGQRLLLVCPDGSCLGLLGSLAAADDLLSLPVSAARAAGVSLSALGPQRMLLGECRVEGDIALGLGLGIGLFEGKLVETLLAEAR